MKLSSLFVFCLAILVFQLSTNMAPAAAAYEDDQHKLENLLETQQVPESVFEELSQGEPLPPSNVDRRPAIIGTATLVPPSEVMDSVSVSPAESARPADDFR